MGSALFTMHVKSPATIAQWYRVKYQLYADDTELCVSQDPGNKTDVPSSLNNLEHCIGDIQLWMTNNFFDEMSIKLILYIQLNHTTANL